MTLSLKHAFASGKSDGTDATLVQPSNWNAEHTILMATGKILGRATAGTGAVEELGVTGTGSVALADSPVFTTQITAPLHIGGTGVGSSLTLESTSGVGSSDAIILKTGSQLERLRVDTSGNIIIGYAASVSGKRVQIHGVNSNESAWLDIINWGGTTGNASVFTTRKSGSGVIGTHGVLINNEFISDITQMGSDGVTFGELSCIRTYADAASSAGSTPGRLSFWTTPSAATVAVERLRIDSAGLLTAKYGLLSTHDTVGMGYGTGAGGAVTQITSNTMPVTLNKVAGVITTKGDAIASNATVAFIVNSSAMAATDIPVVSIKSAGTSAAWRASVTRCVATNFTILLTNISAGSLTEAVDISFAIIKSVNS